MLIIYLETLHEELGLIDPKYDRKVKPRYPGCESVVASSFLIIDAQIV